MLYSKHAINFSTLRTTHACAGEIVLSNDKAVQMSPLQLHCINKRMTLPLASSGKGEECTVHKLIVYSHRYTVGARIIQH